MAFPTSPVNGQQAIVNGILYTYASATQSWTRVQGVAGNITLTGILTADSVNAATIGNAGAAIIGNLTGSATTATTAQYVTGLTSANVTTALGYTPANIAGDTFTGNITGTGETLTGNITASSYIISGSGVFWSNGTAYSSGGGSDANITATDNTTSTVLYPVMVGAAGSSQVANVTTSKMTFDATTGNLTVSNVKVGTGSGGAITGLASLTVTGTITSATLNAATIGNAGAAIVGNLTGSATTATTAQYVTGLTSSNVTTALGYTPANIAGDTFTGNIAGTEETLSGNITASSYIISGSGVFWSNGDPYSSGGGGSGGFWEQDEDFDLVTANVATSYDLGSVTDLTLSESWDIGLIAQTGVVDGGSIIDYTIVGSKLATDITISTAGNIIAGNVQADYFVGNGSQLTGVTSVNLLAISSNVIPSANATYDLGSTTNRWNNIYTSDLSLSNQFGDWTIVEGEDDLFLYNNKKGKTYKFMLQEVDPSTAPPKRGE